MTAAHPNDLLKRILPWCRQIFGPVEVVADPSREHPGQRASVHRLRTPSGFCYLKTHRDASHWASEVYAYQHWAPALGEHAPRLLAVRSERPLALVISELPGELVESARLTRTGERAIWRGAGKGLAALHQCAEGDFFGPIHADGTPGQGAAADAPTYLTAELDDLVARGMRISCLTRDDLAMILAARELIPVFVGERPCPCHRDFGPANWLYIGEDQWSGVIDFEFSYWDVRMAEFARYPNWEWINRPDLIEAIFEGYGRSLSAQELQQLLFARALYAVGALVWGEENDYHIFAAEGRRALHDLNKAFD